MKNPVKFKEYIICPDSHYSQFGRYYSETEFDLVRNRDEHYSGVVIAKIKYNPNIKKCEISSHDREIIKNYNNKLSPGLKEYVSAFCNLIEVIKNF